MGDQQAFDDQRRTAAHEAYRHWRGVAERLSERDPKAVVVDGARPKNPTWADQFLLGRIAQRAKGDPELFICEHLASPGVTYLPTWAVVMACELCMLRFPPSEQDDGRCDICQDHPSSGTVPYVVRIGEYVVAGSICMACRDSEFKQVRE